ncbi:MAG: ABC transporter permease subunit [Eubacteriales bacterium]|nr:ABC transporter permease subunit [Eubacteriales bacterium]
MKVMTDAKKKKRWPQIRRRLYRNRYLYLLIAVPIVYFIIFKYLPMYGVVIAFENFKIRRGIFGSEWVGFSHFKEYLFDPAFWKLVRNTLLLSFWQILIAFPLPVIFALLVNELPNRRFAGLVQNVSFLPHFISVVVVVSMLTMFCSRDGIINDLIAFLGGTRTSFLIESKYFRFLYVASEVWQNTGWSAIIYIAALSNVNMELYEAAKIDGAGRFRQILNISLPCILPTIVTMLILNTGQMMNVSFDKVLLMQNAATYEVSDIISTYVYRRGLEGAQYSYAAAIDLFSSVINLTMLCITNAVSKKLGQDGLW